MYLVHALDSRDRLNGTIQLTRGVYCKVNRTYRNAVNGLGFEFDDRQVQFPGDAVNQVAQQMISVNTTNLNTHRIEKL